MYIVTATFLFLLFAAVDLSMLQNEQVENLKLLFCDLSNHALNAEVDMCFQQYPLQNDQVTVDVALECFSGVSLPIDVHSSRSWHCDSGRSDLDLLMPPQAFHILEQNEICLVEALKRHTNRTPVSH